MTNSTSNYIGDELGSSKVQNYFETMRWAVLEIRALDDDNLGAARDIAHKHQGVPSITLECIARSQIEDLKQELELDCVESELDLSILRLLKQLFAYIASLDEETLPKVRLIADTFHKVSIPRWLDPKHTGEILAEIDRRASHHGIESFVDDIKHRAEIV